MRLVDIVPGKQVIQNSLAAGEVFKLDLVLNSQYRPVGIFGIGN